MNDKISPNDRSELIAKGFSDQEINKALQELDTEEMQKSYDQTQQSKTLDPRKNSQHSAFTTRQDQDIVKYQLELNDILERAEHILRGDVPKFKSGHLIWEETKNPEDNTLNEKGIQELMKNLAMYINRNTILADYGDEEINLKVYDFGKALNRLIFMKAEEFGINTEEKRKNYPMLVLQIKDMVHSAYARAKDGGERRSLREMIQIQQSTNTQGFQQGGMQGGMPMQRPRGVLNPMRYVMGRYK